MRTSVTALFCILIIAACAQHTGSESSWTVTIKGKITAPQADGKIYINELRPDRPGRRDSISVNADNTYSKTMTLTEPGYYALTFYGRQFNVILSRSDITVNVDNSDLQKAPEILGSPEQDAVTAVQKIMSDAENSPEMNTIKQELTAAAQANNAEKVAEYQQKYIGRAKVSTDAVAAYLSKQPASLILVELLAPGNVLPKDQYESVYQDAAAKLKKAFPNSVFVKPFLDEMERAKAIAIGAVAPEIQMPDPTGRIIKLSSLRGKYVLVDFWAKWCGPCRRENPNVVSAYTKFKDKGFEVFGVSLDRDKADWIQAIKEDGLVWTQVSDLRPDSRAARDYGVNAIPFSILLDPNGVIIAKNLRGSLLEEKLAEIFK